jgi:hypothetical protein
MIVVRIPTTDCKTTLLLRGSARCMAASYAGRSPARSRRRALGRYQYQRRTTCAQPARQKKHAPIMRLQTAFPARAPATPSGVDDVKSAPAQLGIVARDAPRDAVAADDRTHQADDREVDRRRRGHGCTGVGRTVLSLRGGVIVLPTAGQAPRVRDDHGSRRGPRCLQDPDKNRTTVVRIPTRD